MPATDAPTTEIGHVTTWSQFAGSALGRWQSGVPVDTSEESDAWQWPESIRTVDRMWHSSQIGSTWWALTLPMLGDIWSIDPQDADPARVALLSEDIDLPVLADDGRERIRPKRIRRRGRFSWPNHLGLLLLYLKYGHFGFEQVYDAEALDQTGQARLRKLAPRLPHTISHIGVEEDGGLKEIRQWSAKGNGQTPPIPVDRLVWHVHGKVGANWQGESLFRAAFGDFTLVDRLIRVRAMTGERNGMGVPWAEAPPNATQGQIDAAAEVAMRYRAGEYSGLAMPPGFKLHLAGVEGTLPDLSAAISDHRAMIAETVQAQFMKLGRTESGNRALGETFFDAFVMAIDSVNGTIADVTTQHVVEDWWDLNYGPDDPAPAVVARPIDAERDISPAAVGQLVTDGAIQPDDDIEAWLRARYRMPRRDMDAPRPAPPAPVPPPLDVAASVGDVVRREIADAFAARSQVVAASAPPTRAEDDVLARVAAALSDVVSRPTEAPQVTVAAAPPANVTVEAPPAPNVVVQSPPPANVVVEAPPAPSVTVNMPPRSRRIERDAQGNITRIIDEE